MKLNKFEVIINDQAIFNPIHHLLVTFKKEKEKITLVVLKVTELYLHCSKAKMCYRVDRGTIY